MRQLHELRTRPVIRMVPVSCREVLRPHHRRRQIRDQLRESAGQGGSRVSLRTVDRADLADLPIPQLRQTLIVIRRVATTVAAVPIREPHEDHRDLRQRRQRHHPHRPPSNPRVRLRPRIGHPSHLRIGRLNPGLPSQPHTQWASPVTSRQEHRPYAPTGLQVMQQIRAHEQQLIIGVSHDIQRPTRTRCRLGSAHRHQHPRHDKQRRQNDSPPPTPITSAVSSGPTRGAAQVHLLAPLQTTSVACQGRSK